MATNTFHIGNKMFTNRQQNVYSYLVSPQATNNLLKATNTCLIGNKYLPYLMRNAGVTPFCLAFGNFVYLADTSLDAMVLKNPKLICYALLVYILLVTCYLLSVIRYVLYVISSLMLSAISYIYNALGVMITRIAYSMYRNAGFTNQYNIQLNN